MKTSHKVILPFFAACLIPITGFAANPSPNEIVSQCEAKNAGSDQRTKLTITLKDKSDNKKKNVYQRLWKDYKGNEDVFDKMVLYTEFPPDAKGTGFMRWSYTDGRPVDQWLYLPVLRKTRRVSIRDKGESFLGSDLTHADIDPRSPDADTHKLLQVEQRNGKEFYVVESIPKEDDPQYGKRISWYKKAPEWSGCEKVKIEYYDAKQQLLKTQFIKWQQVDGAWVWRKVMVNNVQTHHSSMFDVSDVEVDVGLDDSLFTERALRRGNR